MNRKTFVETACIAMARPYENEKQRRDHAGDVRKTAEAIADELELAEAAAPDWQSDDLRATRDELRAAQARIAELEADLEKATAPKARPR